MRTGIMIGLGLVVALTGVAWADVASEPYLLDTGLTSRSISFENPTGLAEAGFG